MRNSRPFSPSRIRGREAQRAAADVVADAPPPSKRGEHSVWCDVVVIERGCYPILARGVVVVLTETKIFLRVAATAFTFTVHVQDVAQVRHVVPKGVVELHVRLPETSAGVSSSPQRLYRLEVTERNTDLAGRLFRSFLDVLPFPSQQRTAQETHTDDAVAAYVVEAPRAMLPLDQLRWAGLQELCWIGEERDAMWAAKSPTPSPSSSVKAESICIAHGHQTPGLSYAANNAVRPESAAVSAAHLRKIYVAPAPSFWRLPKQSTPSPQLQDAPLSWTAARGQSTPPRHPAVKPTSGSTPLAALNGHHVHRPHHSEAHKSPPVYSSARDVVDMSSRESSLMADMCGLRPLAALTSAPPSSSRTSHNTDRTIHVRHGPVVSL